MNRFTTAWRRMPPEHRLAAIASGGLFVAMFLPWYQLTVRTKDGLASTRLTAFGDFSFVEAAVLLVALGVLVLLFARAERRAFHLPGGDGTIILLAGGWATLLLAYRAFDKPGDPQLSAVGLEWGFVFAFAAAGALAYAGVRLRAAHRPEPPLPPALRADPPTEPTRPRPPAPATAVTEVGAHRAPARDPAPDMELTGAHGSEEPLPPDDDQ